MTIDDLRKCIKNETSYCLDSDMECETCKPCIPDFTSGSKRQPIFDPDEEDRRIKEKLNNKLLRSC